MNVPMLGEMTKTSSTDWLYSPPLPLPLFGGKLCRIVLEDYEADEHKEAFHTAIANFLAAKPAVLREADEPLFRYYKDNEECWQYSGYTPITSFDELWQHVTLGAEPMLKRRAYGDKGVYISIECECDWEIEHGLQIVMKNGLKISKLGQLDGHLTNSDAYGDPRLENAIYKGL
jgi:hypothetical protein